MFITINTSSGLPIYRQITDQVRAAVASGELAPGDRLPSVRALSEQLVVNPTTVQRAYLDLERDSLIESRRGQGTFVRADAGRGEEFPEAERLARAAAELRRAVTEAKGLRVPEDEVRRLASREIDDVYGARRGAAKEA